MPYLKGIQDVPISTVLLNVTLPDGKVIKAAAVYGPSHTDDPEYWKNVHRLL